MEKLNLGFQHDKWRYLLLHSLFTWLQIIVSEAENVKSTKTAYFGSKVIYAIYYMQDHLRALRY